MRFWTGYLRPDAAPVLVREGFSWGALIFGPLWLAAHRAWIPAALTLAAIILIVALTSGPSQAVLLLALAVWLGLCGHDLRRWSLRLRGFTLLEVVSARDDTEALGRLLGR
ncbi:MAG TPA: DUF2628 domain-containing protein, partial [Acetobacteraceae bacterium]|nr:DUF2628 domain-containing protein [Acetobacteraceae bacterium]